MVIDILNISYIDIPWSKIQNYSKNWSLGVTVAMVTEVKVEKLANLTYFEAI